MTFKRDGRATAPVGRSQFDMMRIEVPLNLFDFAGGVQILDWDGSYAEPDWSTFTNGPEKTTTKQSGAYIATHLRPIDRLSILAGSRGATGKPAGET